MILWQWKAMSQELGKLMCSPAETPGVVVLNELIDELRVEFCDREPWSPTTTRQFVPEGNSLVKPSSPDPSGWTESFS